MAEIKTITADGRPAQDTDHVVIRRAPIGRYSATALVQSGAKEATSWTPAAFGSLDDAPSEARAWAEANGVSAIHIEKARD